ncbi:MAG TPA: sigma-70 family RNA polymerase sigma factor, partial [Planctomycetota bacterium]|nr:sigma-70 family RNA polymerase sigma factor [Planctomycetota bacterium]
MNARRLDRLFERFRRKGDVQALGEVFDAAAPELYRVAVHLTRNLHQAEDLVQSTFLAAIEARGSYDSKRELLPWLLGILTRKAVWERRKLSRVIEPDRLEAHVAEEPSSEAESRELSKSVEDAVEQLPAPYREVLVAHLRAGKSPQEIAFELGRAPGTVRVQLHRGLELLRRALPVGLTMGVAITALSPRGLAAIRSAVLSSAASVAAVPVGIGVVSSTGLIGGIAMGAKFWITAAGLLAAIAWLGFTEAKPTLATLAPEQSLASVVRSLQVEEASAQGEELESNVAAQQIRAQRTAVEDASRPAVVTPTSVSGQLLLPDGTPATGAFVGLLRNSHSTPGDLVVEGTTRRDGRFDLHASQGSYFLVGFAKRLLPTTREVTLVTDSELKLEPISLDE